jgi:hypothetical protein
MDPAEYLKKMPLDKDGYIQHLETYNATLAKTNKLLSDMSIQKFVELTTARHHAGALWEALDAICEQMEHSQMHGKVDVYCVLSTARLEELRRLLLEGKGVRSGEVGMNNNNNAVFSDGDKGLSK